MNFVFISPTFPKTYWNFCDRLKARGVNVLAIGDTPYDYLAEEVKRSVTEYYYVYSMEDYDQMLRAVAFFIFKYGKIDFLESNNEYWLVQDAKLRTDFNITSGIQNDRIDFIKHKSEMKAFYKKAGIPSARYHLVTTLDKAQSFIKKVGYPVIVKPDDGVGASHTYKISNDEELEAFFDDLGAVQYIMEEYVEGIIESFDGFASLDKKILFETSHVFPDPIMNIVNGNKDMYYYSVREIPEDLKALGHKAVEAFPTEGRPFHMEFFRLTQDKPGLAKKGELVGLEVNMRCPGGYTPDMMNYANDIDVYSIYADMIVKGDSDYNRNQRPYYCVYCGRRDGNVYTHSYEDFINRYLGAIVMAERMPDILSGAMGNYCYMARFKTMDELNAYVEYVLG